MNARWKEAARLAISAAIVALCMAAGALAESFSIRIPAAGLGHLAVSDDPTVSCGASQILNWTGSEFECVDLVSELQGLERVVVAENVTNGEIHDTTASCPSGKKLVGGGCTRNAPNNVWMSADLPSTDDTWLCTIWNNSGVTRSLAAYALCVEAQ